MGPDAVRVSRPRPWKTKFRAARRGACMATAWRRAMTYLGLGPDEAYDDYDEVEPLRDHAQERTSRQGPPAGPRQGPPMRKRKPESEPSDVTYVAGERRMPPPPVAL